MVVYLTEHTNEETQQTYNVHFYLLMVVTLRTNNKYVAVARALYNTKNNFMFVDSGLQNSFTQEPLENLPILVRWMCQARPVVPSFLAIACAKVRM